MANTEINVVENGPIIVKGAVTVHDSAGNAYDLKGKEMVALCRCAHSANAPFCDGSHKASGFESKVSAS